MALKYDGSVAQLLHAHDFGSHHSVRHAAVTDPDCSWEKRADCNYSGAPASIADHRPLARDDDNTLDTHAVLFDGTKTALVILGTGVALGIAFTDVEFADFSIG